MKFEMEKGKGREGGMAEQSRAEPSSSPQKTVDLFVHWRRPGIIHTKSTSHRRKGKGEMMRCLARISKDESGTQADNYWRISRSDYHYYGALRGSA